MGIYYSGGMIIGEAGSKVNVPEEFEDDVYEWLEDNDMEYMSLYYDADSDGQIFGFKVSDIPVSDIDEEWLALIKERAEKFEELTGVPARLIGTQDIW